MASDHLSTASLATRPAVRCAIYTRKSTDENLDTDFNSLDAQREAAENYIRSQTQEGWVALPEHYDDGAFSGATLGRPALQRLLRDVEVGKVDVVVIYKIDRLSRSLLDFAKLVEIFDRHKVTMVSVTQPFNTTTSMGRLTLNVLLSFAQFEREVITERIRDKVAGAKRRGKWLGGTPPLGYDIDRPNKRLVVNASEAVLVRTIFRRFLQLGSTVALINELNTQGLCTKSWTTVAGRFRQGGPWDKAHIYKLLNNPLYTGLVQHKGQTYPGEHEAIIERSLWDEVQSALSGNARARANRTRATTPALLKNIIRCGHCDKPMGITFTKKGARRYRYYLCQNANKSGYEACPVRTVPAGDVERAVMIQLQRVFQAPEIIEETLKIALRREEAERKRLTEEQERIRAELKTLQANTARLRQSKQGKGRHDFTAEEIIRLEAQSENLTQRLATVQAERDQLDTRPPTRTDLSRELATLDRIWEELFPREKERIINLLVESVVVSVQGIDLSLRADGLRSITAELANQEVAHA